MREGQLAERRASIISGKGQRGLGLALPEELLPHSPAFGKRRCFNGRRCVWKRAGEPVTEAGEEVER